MAHTGTFMGRSIVATILAVLMPAGHAFADCKLGRIAELPVTMVDMRAMVTGQINGTDVQFAASIGQLSMWITAHQEDMRLAGALGERCWGRALLGQDLNEALDDCNRALKRVDKTDVIRAQALNARGLVRLRLGDYDKSIADYDASLSLRPKDAWALYGRGVDKLRRGKSSEGRTDLADATATWPPVAAAFEKHGILP